MSNNIGTIVVEVAANVARFQSDTQKIAAIAEQNAKRIEKAFDIVGTSLKALGAGFAIGLTLDKIKDKISGAIEATAALQNLADRTGGTVEGLSGLVSVAKLTGTGIDELATGLQKLSKNMVDAEAGGAKTSDAFQAIGINTKQLVGLKPDQAFLLIANQLDHYADGANKTAIAQALLGKAGANLLPTMKDLAVVGQYQVKANEEQARVAEEYEKNLKRLDAVQNAIFKRIGFEITPVLNDFVKTLLDVAKGTNGVQQALGDLAKDGSLRKWAENVAIGLAVVIETFQGIAKAVVAVIGSVKVVAADLTVAATFANPLNASKFLTKEGRAELKQVLDDRNKTLEEANKKYVDLWNFDARAIEKSLEARFAQSRKGFVGPPAPPKPDPKFTGGNANAAAELRALLDEQIKVQERYIQRENALYQQREQYLQRLYDEDLLSINGYFDSRQKASEDHLAAVLGAYDKEIAALQRYAVEAGKGSERIRAQTQIQEVQIKRTEALNAQGAKSEQLAYDQAKAQRAYADSIENLNIKLLQLQGNLEEAAKRQALLSNRQVRQRLTVEGNTAGLATLDEIERQEALRARLNEMNERAGVIAERQATAEGRAQLAFNRGTIGEFESLRKVGEARAKSIEQLEAIATEMERVAAATGDPRLLANAEAFRLKLDELRASSDALANKFNDMFEKSFASAFGDFINGTKSASQAFKSFANDVVQQINRMVAESLAKQLFGSGGSGSGAGGFFAGLFGGGGGTAGNNPSAYTGGGGGFGDAVGSFFSSIFGGGRASGGPVSAGMMYEINERRMPEVASLGGRDYLLTGGQGGRVSPAQAGGGPLIGQIVFQGPMPTDRRAQTQFLAELGQTVSRASGRNG